MEQVIVRKLPADIEYAVLHDKVIINSDMPQHKQAEALAVFGRDAENETQSSGLHQSLGRAF